MYVYMAGKMDNHPDWRAELLSSGSWYSTDPYERDHDAAVRSAFMNHGDPTHPTRTISGDHYSGPWGLWCDHGHLVGNHGSDTICCAEPPLGNEFWRREVLWSDLDSIASSDWIFVYLSDWDAFGTIAEIGWAFGHDKPIYLYAAPDLPDDLWFCRAMTREVEAPTLREAFLLASAQAASSIADTAKRTIPEASRELARIAQVSQAEGLRYGERLRVIQNIAENGEAGKRR